MAAVTASLASTLFSFLDIPVFWPILVLYFVVLMGMTLRKQIAHMWEHGYVPVDIGKPQHGAAGGFVGTARNCCAGVVKRVQNLIAGARGRQAGGLPTSSGGAGSSDSYSAQYSYGSGYGYGTGSSGGAAFSGASYGHGFA